MASRNNGRQEPARTTPARTALRTASSTVAAAGLILAGCSGGDGGGGDGSGDGRVSILVTKHALTGPVEEMGWVTDLEELADVTIEWEEVSSDWDQKKSTMLAAGDVPDLIVGTNAITDSDLATFGTLFEDLSDDLAAMPNVEAMFAENPELESMATQTGGEVYAIGGYRRFWPETVTHQYINQQWLDEVGLDVPTTWDELFDVLVAFKEQDANGNGDPNDEIPMDWSPVGTDGFGYFQPSVLLGSLGLPISSGGGQGYFLEDGEVGNFLVDERYREVIEFLRRCYAEGLISEDVMTQDYSAYQSVGRGDGDTARVGFSWGWTASDRFGAQLAEQYVATAPLLAEAGQSEPVTWTYDGYGENYPANQIVMSANAGDKEAALRVVDAFYEQDISLQVLWGEFGENIEKVSDTEYEVLPPADGTTDPSTWKWTTTIADLGPMWIRDDIDVTLPTDLQEARDDTEPLQEALDNMDLEQDVYPSQFIQFSQEDQNTLALNDTNILNITQTKFAEWITSGGVEDEWDSYVSQVEGSGLGDNIEIHQRYYDEYMADQG
ncbi:extracellular solute-binding protein [Phytoactinopolyspora halotolerans]|uniref:Extracellular solute-binding protein n=1 Tax=Phytoactinopolyspora halotolerans TaxID=1981512 RepID=A0A6L9S8P2_9ACTN|nr:extracellular solute-binding protein [Phytoactinopolyspora halotolerans]NEE00888.1 extracellular solute-binding protein [Phytoactinopolyspora halotolerans]